MSKINILGIAMDKKKKLLVIGNKEGNPTYNGEMLPLDKYLDMINSMDYICRINRMQNYGVTTGTRIDGIYIGAFYDYVEKYKGGKNVDALKYAKNIFIDKIAYEGYFVHHFDKFFDKEQISGLTLTNFEEGRERMGYRHPCSVISMIDWFSYNKPWCDEYEIWFCGIDVQDRENVLKYGWQWCGVHSQGGKQEKEYLEKLMNEGKIKWIDEELWKECQ